MLDLSTTPDQLLDPIRRVVETVLPHATGLRADGVMVIGAWCRDIIHHALGHDFATAATSDLDLALALASWTAYRDVSAAMPQAGGTGIRFQIAKMNVDLLPFGAIEDPEGIVAPPTRDQAMSVWAFDEIFAGSLPLMLSSELAIRIPSIAGYGATKVGAWLDRSEWGESKDATDLALATYWYAESTHVHNRLYETSYGSQILLSEDVDVPRAAANLLGADIMATIGRGRADELVERWPGDIDFLVREFRLRSGPSWPGGTDRRRTIVDALTRGLSSRP